MSPQKTTIDWLRFRVKAGQYDVLEALRPMFGTMGAQVALKQLERGVMGFEHASTVTIGDMVIGRVDYGGASQRGWARVDISGKGCEFVQDWPAVEVVEALPAAEIRRLDVALTTWKGEVGHDRVVRAHQAGRFITRGRPPALQQITSSDPRAGRTCYVGKREQSDKFVRCYEKGFELAAKMQARGLPGYLTEIDGCRVEDIYRCEVEFKASSTDIPWDVIGRRDQYFAGSYPFCADVLPGVEADILQRRPEREVRADLAAALENCRVQFGPTIFTALMAYHGDMTTVWEKIIGANHCQRLIEAGVLLVDHD